MWKSAILLAVTAHVIYEVSTEALCDNPNEEYDACSAPCPPRRCGVDESLILCQVPAQPGDPDCEPGCRCLDNYVRNDEGICIPKDQYPSDSCKGDPNAKPGCGVNCGRLCSNYKNDDVSCIQICYDDGCDCKENYILDTNTGKCVLPDQCTPTCKANEVFSNCTQAVCRIQDCSQKGKPISCALVAEGYCNKGCVCAENYLRDSNGNCVPEDQCDAKELCNKHNEVYVEDCSPENCESISKSYSCPALPACTGQCRCKPGYFRNKLGECITKEQCSTETEASCGGDPNAQPGCGVNCGRLCSNYKNADQVACSDVCNVNGCDCKEGYVLDDNIGKCVLPDQCSTAQNQCSKPNEEYQKCPDCSPGTCESIGKIYNCPLEPADSSECTGECRCKSGYYRNKIGECITEEQCLQCNGTNEYFSCGPECDNVCATLDQQSKSNCPIRNIQCNKKCYCEDGYARDENNICVPIDQCTGGCKENERYVECPDAECVPQTCADAGFPVACPRIANGRCPSKPACICKSGYLRNSDGVCVPQNECPTCGGDPNARPGCGVNCGRLCSNYQNSDGVACPAVCNLNGCDCAEGYVLDTNTGKCVLPEQCTSPCGQNEVYSNCVNGGCDKRNCSQINDPKVCIDPLECDGGCVCQDGYLRDSNGVCVPQDQCEEKCPDGETFSDCPPVYSRDCNLELCPQSRDDPSVCPATTRQCGEPRCVCTNLRRRNRETGQCVLASDCPPFPCTGQNEVYDSCPASCPGQNCSDYINNSTCPTLFRIGIAVPCKPACRCDKDTFRNSEGVCVSGAECKSDSS